MRRMPTLVTHTPSTFSRMALVAMAAMALIATGCASEDKQLSAQPTYDDPYLTPPTAGPIASPAPSPTTGASTLTLGTSNTTDPAGPVGAVAKPVTAIDPAPSLEPATRTYKVQKGDTLWGIATREYGKGSKWKDIVAANPGLEPTKMRVGQTITLP